MVRYLLDDCPLFGVHCLLLGVCRVLIIVRPCRVLLLLLYAVRCLLFDVIIVYVLFVFMCLIVCRLFVVRRLWFIV